MLERLSQDLIIADWQYNAVQAPVETSSVFVQAGFECLLCPWDQGVPQMRAAIATVKEQSVAGFLHTTWHTLSTGMPFVALAAMGGFEDIDICGMEQIRTYTAALLRKVMPIGGDYAKAGWSKVQVHYKW